MKKFAYSLLLLLLSVVTVYITTWEFPEYSVLGFVILAITALEMAIHIHDKVVFTKLDIENELQEGNLSVGVWLFGKYLAFAIILAAALLAVPKGVGQPMLQEPVHISVAAKYVGTQEQRGNRGRLIDQWNKGVHAPLGSPYCASFVSWCLSQAAVAEPAVRSASSRAFVTKRSIPILSATKHQLQAFPIIVWKRRGGGHVGFIRREKNGWITTIEANTSSGNRGSQWNGGGVWQRYRNLKQIASPYNVFRATHITMVNYHRA